jgi:hypothetical protein
VVELVRQRLSHTPRIANLAATNFARFDDAKALVEAKQSIDHVLSNLDS